MKIKLIAPESTVRPMDSAWKTRMSPPLSLLVLGALTPGRHEVCVEDRNIERGRMDETADLVGVTVKVDTVYRARRISADYRRRGIPVVWGGIYPTMCPEHCAPFADCVVVGEAETIWPKLLEHAEQRALKKIYRAGTAPDIATVPVPRWELLKEHGYLFTNTIRIGRGCPWRCDFCYNSAPNIEAGYRAKPIGHVLREIDSLGTRHVMFIDDNFIGSPVYARRLLARLQTLGLTWHAAVSADIGRHPDILDMMAESGCKSLFIGFESINPRNLASCGKDQNRVAHYDSTIRAIHERGMMVNASLVFGFDDDDEAVFPATLEWLVRNRIETMTAHILTPYPGTVLYKRLRRERRIIDHDLRHYNTAHVVLEPARLSAHELARGYRWIYSQFYSLQNIVRRCPQAAAQRAAYLQFNFLYRKFGKVTSLLGKAFGMRNLARLATAVAYAPEGSGTRSEREGETLSSRPIETLWNWAVKRLGGAW